MKKKFKLNSAIVSVNELVENFVSNFAKTWKKEKYSCIKFTWPFVIFTKRIRMKQIHSHFYLLVCVCMWRVRKNTFKTHLSQFAFFDNSIARTDDWLYYKAAAFVLRNDSAKRTSAAAASQPHPPIFPASNVRLYVSTFPIHLT